MKKHEFSKLVVLWVLILGALWVSASYILSAFGRDPVETVTVAVITTLIIVPVGYFAKSFGEKNSRNKHHVDERGEFIKEENNNGTE